MKEINKDIHYGEYEKEVEDMDILSKLIKYIENVSEQITLLPDLTLLTKDFKYYEKY